MSAKMIAFVVAILALVGIAVWWLAPAAEAELLHGDIEVRELRVATKVPGRVLRLHVQEGDKVSANDLLFELSSPELDAMLAQAMAAEDAAKALQDEAKSGLRSEQVEVARLEWQRALIEKNLLEKTKTRIANLYQQGLVSQQHYDEVVAKAAASADQALAAEAMYQMASSGAREEQIRAVEAQTRRAAAAVSEVQAFRAETEARAPIDGQVASIVIHEGELAPQGYPVITLIDPTDVWAVFNIREDKLKQLAPGATFRAYVPALDQQLEFRVRKLAALPSFANWKQVQGTPGYDLKTFQIEAAPTTTVAGLHAGMTVIMSLTD